MEKNRDSLLEELPEAIRDLDYDESALYALFFKQTAFASEKEYRFVFRNPPNQVYFREQNGFLLPYIVIDCSADAKLPVKSVTVAPKNHIDLARRGMEYYLSSLGYKVPVKLSQLKLRY